ncbi:MAG: hypothetical protein AAF611_12305 [Bacteroidota bacterium]
MKKKNLKSLKLNKKIISNFESQTVTGGTSGCITITYYTEEIADILFDGITWIYDCSGEEGSATSSACADTQNDTSCNCTVA